MAVPAKSSGSAHLPSGIRERTLFSNSENSEFSRKARVISVLIKPGAIAFTRMPSSANAIANDLVSETTPVWLRCMQGIGVNRNTNKPNRCL
jgi:hypothetical protein